MAKNWFAVDESRKMKKATFADVLSQIEESEFLSAALAKSKEESKFYPEGYEFDLSQCPKKAGKLSQLHCKTVHKAKDVLDSNPGYRVAVLNFASATSPGGAVLKGWSAQEESISRISSLYPVLTQDEMMDAYYTPNKKSKDPRKAIHKDDLIYGSEIMVVRDLETEERIPDDECFKMDVITCSAPNLKDLPQTTLESDGQNVSVTKEELYDIHVSRAKHILKSAIVHGADVIILGAFGCGVFKNDAAVVAKAYNDVLVDLKDYFEEVIFAIPGKGYNYDSFAKYFENKA